MEYSPYSHNYKPARRPPGPSPCRLLAAALLGIVPGTSGCVERLLLVRSDPPGASVYVNGAEAGTTPLEHPFSFYGTVEVTLRREGFLSHRELKILRAPWYEAFPLDLFSEHLVPWTIRDHHELEVRLAPSPERIDEEEGRALEKKAALLRHAGKDGPAPRGTDGPEVSPLSPPRGR